MGAAQNSLSLSKHLFLDVDLVAYDDRALPYRFAGGPSREIHIKFRVFHRIKNMLIASPRSRFLCHTFSHHWKKVSERFNVKMVFSDNFKLKLETSDTFDLFY